LESGLQAVRKSDRTLSGRTKVRTPNSTATRGTRITIESGIEGLTWIEPSQPSPFRETAIWIPRIGSGLAKAQCDSPLRYLLSTLRPLLPLRALKKRWIDFVERNTRKDLTGVGKRKQRAEALGRLTPSPRQPAFSIVFNAHAYFTKPLSVEEVEGVVKNYAACLVRRAP